LRQFRRGLFDVFFTQPYGPLSISESKMSRPMPSCFVAASSSDSCRRATGTSWAGHTDVVRSQPNPRRCRDAASGAGMRPGVRAVASELKSLLGLRDCWFRYRSWMSPGRHRARREVSESPAALTIGAMCAAGLVATIGFSGSTPTYPHTAASASPNVAQHQTPSESSPATAGRIVNTRRRRRPRLEASSNGCPRHQVNVHKAPQRTVLVAGCALASSPKRSYKPSEPLRRSPPRFPPRPRPDNSAQAA